MQYSDRPVRTLIFKDKERGDRVLFHLLQTLGSKLAVQYPFRITDHQLTGRVIEEICPLFQRPSEVSISNHSKERSFVINNPGTPQSFGSDLENCLPHEFISLDQRHGISGVHHIAYREEKLLPECTTGVKKSKILLLEAPLNQKRNCKCIAHGQGGGSRSGRRKAKRTCLLFYCNVQMDIACLCQG